MYLKVSASRTLHLCVEFFFFVVKEKISVLQNTPNKVLKEEPKKAKFAI